MKRANNLFPKLVSEENLRLAIFAVNVTHRFHPHHRPNRTVARVEADIDRYVKELREIITGGYEANEPRLARRWDKSAGKWRDISEPRLWPDQYVHHAVIQVLEPIMMRGMDNFCCGSIRNRGIHYGVRAIKKWMRTDPKGTKYAEELVKKMEKSGAKAYLVNTGWNGTGKRISIKDTRGIIDAILDGSILKAPTKKIPYFDFEVPTELPGVDSKILDPRDTYADASEWEKKAQDLASRFIKNFAKYEGNEAGKKLVAAGPKL